ncbi:MAG: hypothetical protein IPH36_14925 [Saprospiraceae bacterium]|nr:hypothetical protein [Saprospiraceae bacterium]
MKKCKMCPTMFYGRSDKIFCSAKCKTAYHEKLNKVTNEATAKIDKILHRNRSILLEILGKKANTRRFTEANSMPKNSIGITSLPFTSTPKTR